MVTLTSGCHFDNLKHMPQTSALIECKDERWGEGGLCVLSSLTPQVIKMTFTNASLTLQRWSDHPVQHDLTTPQINPPSESLHLGQIFWTHLLRRFHTSLCKRITATGYSRPMCSNTSCTSRNTVWVTLWTLRRTSKLGKLHGEDLEHQSATYILIGLPHGVYQYSCCSMSFCHPSSHIIKGSVVSRCEQDQLSCSPDVDRAIGDHHMSEK